MYSIGWIDWRLDAIYVSAFIVRQNLCIRIVLHRLHAHISDSIDLFAYCFTKYIIRFERGKARERMSTRTNKPISLNWKRSHFVLFTFWHTYILCLAFCVFTISPARHSIQRSNWRWYSAFAAHRFIYQMFSAQCIEYERQSEWRFSLRYRQNCTFTERKVEHRG